VPAWVRGCFTVAELKRARTDVKFR
jgi:hypothetical protein